MAKSEVATRPDDRAALLGEVDLVEVSAEEAHRAIVQGILSADTVQDVLGQAGAVSLQDMLGEPFQLRDMRLLKSSFEEGPGVFGIFQCARPDDGSVFVATCGSQNVMAQALRLRELGALPVMVKCEQSERPSAAGYHPLWLTAA